VGDQENSDSETSKDGNPSWLQNSDSNVSSKSLEKSFDGRSETWDPYHNTKKGNALPSQPLTKIILPVVRQVSRISDS
jgi:hypothetical protein